MSELSSEEKYRLGMISRDQRQLDRMIDQYKNDMTRIDEVEYALGGTEKAKDIRQQAADIQEKKRKIREQEDLERQIEKENERKQWTNTTEGIILESKAKYDEKMNEYMSKNLWGKAKILFAGKKPKKMTDKEIMQTYSSEVQQDFLKKMIEKKTYDKDQYIAWTKSHYTEHPEQLRPGRTIEDMIKDIENTYSYEMKFMKEDYEHMLKSANDLVDKFGMEHFEQKSGLSR